MVDPTPHNRFEELAAGYVLGNLASDEMAEFQQLATEHPALWDEVTGLQETLDLLPFALAESQPQRSARNHIMQSAAQGCVCHRSATNHSSPDSTPLGQNLWQYCGSHHGDSWRADGSFSAPIGSGSTGVGGAKKSHGCTALFSSTTGAPQKCRYHHHRYVRQPELAWGRTDPCGSSQVLEKRAEGGGYSQQSADGTRGFAKGAGPYACGHADSVTDEFQIIGGECVHLWPVQGSPDHVRDGATWAGLVLSNCPRPKARTASVNAREALSGDPRWTGWSILE